jgi:PAS domain S-box-containing protein
MRLRLPRLGDGSISPARAPILRYGVAVFSIILAVIPGFLLTDLVESRLVVFAVAIMVSAWYGGWKPGLVATSFALTVSAYFSLAGQHTHAEDRKAVIHLTLFVFVALLICSFNAALRSAQEALRVSEEKNRSLITNAPYGICRCDARGKLVDVNPAVVTMLGFESASDLLGRDLTTLYADPEQWFQVVDHFQNSQGFTGIEAEWVRKDAIPIVVRLSARPVHGERNNRFFELFAEDVTATRALEQQLRQSQKMEAIGRLAGGIAHDFNNLLMVISGYCEFLLERVGPDPALRGPAQEISSAAKRATSLTRQLLAFSRKQMLAPKVLDLNQVVSESLTMLNRLIGEDIDLVMIPSTELGPIKADPGQIEQVIMNLAVNARDAMPRGGKLTIETSNVTLDANYARMHTPVVAGDYVMLALSDTGAGMDPETQSHIFEPFFTTKGTGTGLGLSMVYGIVKQSGGYIWVYSEPGKGSTFKVYLPRVRENGESVSTQAAVSFANGHHGHETILLVEDESNVRRLGKQYLEKQGYTVLEAAEGSAAMKISDTYPGPIHLLLTDVIMPGMNGRELAQQITFARAETRVLYMSGYTENAIGHNGMLDDGISLLQKPFTLPALKEKVREILDKPSNQEVEVTNAAGTQTQASRLRAKLSPYRAKRFQLSLPLRYRPIGESQWRTGTTENISRSGILFRAAESVPLSVQLEINLVLPAEIAGLSATEVVCRGEIVRTVEPESPAFSPALAAKILQYHFQHGSQLPEA